MNNKEERKYPYYIRGDRNNPEGVIRTIAKVIPEYCSPSWLNDALDKNGGFYINASNPNNIFYINEYNTPDPIRLMDECDSFRQELITSSTAWKELSPYDNKFDTVRNLIEEYNNLSSDLNKIEETPSHHNLLLGYPKYESEGYRLTHLSGFSKKLLIDSIKERLSEIRNSIK